MSLKKFLKTKKRNQAQASLEYFVLLLVMVSLTLLGITTLFPNVKLKGEVLFQKAVERIIE